MKIVFVIIFLIMKILIFNKNLYNNKLQNVLETQAHFLEISSVSLGTDPTLATTTQQFFFPTRHLKS